MSNAQQKPAPITYTSEEQITLGQLENNGRLFSTISNLLRSGSFRGEQAQAVLETLSFVDTLLRNTSQQAQELYQAAQIRANTPAVTATPKETKEEAPTTPSKKLTKAN